MNIAVCTGVLLKFAYTRRTQIRYKATKLYQAYKNERNCQGT